MTAILLAVAADIDDAAAGRQRRAIEEGDSFGDAAADIGFPAHFGAKLRVQRLDHLFEISLGANDRPIEQHALLLAPLDDGELDRLLRPAGYGIENGRAQQALCDPVALQLEALVIDGA